MVQLSEWAEPGLMPVLLKRLQGENEKGNPEPQELTQDSQDLAFLCHTAVKSQSSLQTGAEHEVAIWRKGEPSNPSAVLSGRRRKK